MFLRTRSGVVTRHPDAMASLLCMGQTDDDCAAGKQLMERAPVHELAEQAIFDTLRVESFGQAPREPGLL